MNGLRYTLFSDGASDRALIPILTWLLRQHLPAWAIQPEWADLRRLRRPPRQPSEKIARALELYPCDLLFVHRDAEAIPYQSRVDEIRTAVQKAQTICQGIDLPPYVAVVPVRMTEAWLVFDEAAIRRAAGNPNGRVPLQLPRGDPELIPDPKELLFDFLRTASELSGRRLDRFRPDEKIHRIPEFIHDFSPLDRLTAFRSLRQQVCNVAAHIMGN